LPSLSLNIEVEDSVAVAGVVVATPPPRGLIVLAVASFNLK